MTASLVRPPHNVWQRELRPLAAPVSVTAATPRSHPGLFVDPLVERMVAYLRERSPLSPAVRAVTIRRSAAECWGADESCWPVGVRTELAWAECP